MPPEPVPQQSRRWRRFLVAAGCVLVLLLTLLIWRTSDRFSHRFNRLQPGMTRAEVHQVMGCPPGEYGDPNSYTLVFYVVGPVFTDPRVWPKVRRLDRWVSEEGEFFVGYTGEDRLVATRSNRGEPLTLWMRLKNWWGRFWSRSIAMPTATVGAPLTAPPLPKSNP